MLVCAQICREFERFGKPLNVKVGNFFGGMDITAQRELLKSEEKCPDIVVGTPGRVKQVRQRRCMLRQCGERCVRRYSTALLRQRRDCVFAPSALLLTPCPPPPTRTRCPCAL